MVNDLVVGLPTPLLARTENVKLPAKVGVPVIVPLLLRVSPGGGVLEARL